MKKSFILALVLILGFNAYSQTPFYWFSPNTDFQGIAITWPLNRTVFQRFTDDKANIKIHAEFSVAGSFPSDTYQYYYQIYEVNKLGQRTGARFVTGTTPLPGILTFGIYKKITPYFHDHAGERTLELIEIAGTDLNTGWYDLSIHCYKGDQFHSSSRIRFGVGEVFTIYGQSNAAGLNQDQETGLQPFSNSTTAYDMVNVIGKQSLDITKNNQFKLMNSLPVVNYRTIKDQYDNDVGLIDDLGFRKLERDDLNPTFRSNIYPRGNASWAWLPLGNKFADEGVPTLFFNAAFPGRNISELNNTDNDDYKTFRQTLQMYNNIVGVRTILWHQGEYDAIKQIQKDDNPSPITDFNYYNSSLKTLIDSSRLHFNSGLTWALSGASMFSWKAQRNNEAIQWEDENTPNIAFNAKYNKEAPFDDNYFYSISLSPSVYNPLYLSNTNKTHDTQTYNPNLKDDQQNYSGISNYIAGFNTDKYGLSRRGPKYAIHLTGSALDDLATDWKNLPLTSGTPIKGKEVKSVIVSRSGNTFILTAPSGYDYYFWVANDNSIYAPLNPSTLTNNQIVVEDYTNSFKAVTCYLGTKISGVSGGNSSNGWNLNFEVTYPFLIPGYVGQKSLIVPNSQNIPNSNGSFNVEVSALDINWEASSNVSWLQIPSGSNTGGAGSKNININYSSNSSGSPRVGIITFTAQGGGGISKQLIVTQGNSATSLTTLTPTNSSSEWSGYGSARFDGKTIDGNTTQVSGISYYQGIGTHAESRMVFNLSGGGYTTFYGKVGRPDDADNGSDLGKVKFRIKTDGSEVWVSGVHGNTTGAESFSINVSGKSTLELIVDKYNDEYYWDSANWIDVYLTGGSPPGSNNAPTGVSASPASHGPGGGNSTLTASCDAGATVQWSHGLGNGSPKTTWVSTTTTYTATCVSGSSTDSPPVAVTVTVGPGGCGALTHDLVMGYWTVTGHPLVAKYFHGSWWLVQKINNSPEQFLVRGSEMLTRGDVTLMGSYSGLVECFAHTYSDYGGLASPSSVTFPTPAGYILGYEPDGGPYYTASGIPPSGCTDAYLTNSWTYASAAGSTGSIPKIGQSFDGNNMTMGSVNYSASYPGTGIGTHATSEIIYDLGASHSYTHFKSTVGKDNESVCGEDRMVFKVYNNATGALLDQSPVVGMPSYGLPQTAEMSVDISGVRYLKLVVEDGGDYIYCDHANWARARLACSSSGRMAATDSVASTFFTVYPNVSRGEFTVEVELPMEQEVAVSLISSSGAVYRQESYAGTKGRNVLKFNAGKVMSGLYHVRVSTRERVEAKTVVIEK